jgi:HAD superfamily hydrolase (TIGR01459 family)
MHTAPLALTQHFATLAPNYDVVLSDVWGVVHNGLAAWPDACAALKHFRQAGGTVVMISNAPRPGEHVKKFLDHVKVPRDTYDAIVTSGDVSRAIVASRPGEPMHHLGPQRDLGIFDGLDTRFASIEDAAYVVCTGLLNDDVETPEDYRAQLQQMLARKLLMICGNPDLVVERGDKLVYCAGAIADLYRDMGGDVIYAGKPYRPIYDQALSTAATLRGKDTPRSRVLAIGDSVRTDLKGASDMGVDCLFVTSGIHAEELGGRDDPDLGTLAKLFAEARLAPKAIMRTLVW